MTTIDYDDYNLGTQFNVVAAAGQSSKPSSDQQSSVFKNFMKYFTSLDLYNQVNESGKPDLEMQFLYFKLRSNCELFPPKVRDFIKLDDGHYIKFANRTFRAQLTSLVLMAEFEMMVQKTTKEFTSNLSVDSTKKQFRFAEQIEKFFGKVFQFSQDIEFRTKPRIVAKSSTTKGLKPKSSKSNSTLPMKPCLIEIPKLETERAVGVLKNTFESGSSAIESIKVKRELDEEFDDCELSSDLEEEDLNSSKESSSSNGNGFACSKCPFRTLYLQSLKRHVEYLHSNGPDSYKNSQIRKCLNIIRRNQSQTSLSIEYKPQSRTSKKLNHVTRSYKCPASNCDKNFSHIKLFYSHLRSHKEKFFKCPKCPATYRYPWNIKIHDQNFHTKGPGPKSKVLEPSRTSPNTSINLAIDGRASSSSKLSCVTCGQAFERQWQLAKHYSLNLHDPRKPSPCPLCGHRFKSDGAAETHVSLEHPEAYDLYY